MIHFFQAQSSLIQFIFWLSVIGCCLRVFGLKFKTYILWIGYFIGSIFLGMLLGKLATYFNFSHDSVGFFYIMPFGGCLALAIVMLLSKSKTYTPLFKPSALAVKANKTVVQNKPVTQRTQGTSVNYSHDNEDEGFVINPATGLMMLGAFDIGGNMLFCGGSNDNTSSSSHDDLDDHFTKIHEDSMTYSHEDSSTDSFYEEASRFDDDSSLSSSFSDDSFSSFSDDSFSSSSTSMFDD